MAKMLARVSVHRRIHDDGPGAFDPAPLGIGVVHNRVDMLRATVPDDAIPSASDPC